jgi:class 3 adenylate cyclase
MSVESGLAALFFVELTGFNEAFARDEREALVLLSRYRDYSDPLIAGHGGDIVDITGSELLVSFNSAVAATQCALHLALGLRGLLASSGAAGIKARIGLHMGEIWRQGGKAFGNGVNIAARVMQAAPPGSLYLSEDCYRQVDTKLDLRSREVPGLALKNISRRLALYELDWGEGFAPDTASRGEAADRRARLSSAIKEAVQEALARHADIHINSTPSAPPPAPAPTPLAAPEELGAREAPEILDAPEMPEPPEAPRTPRTPAMELELRRDKAAATIAASVKTLAFNGILGAILGYAYARSDSAWYLAGAALLGLLPCLSALRKLLRAGAELKRIEKQERL